MRRFLAIIKEIIRGGYRSGGEIKLIRNSYSQAGEDVVIDFLLKGIGINAPTYLELGSFSPDKASNTFKFYNNGSDGVLVEADQNLIGNIKEKRPRDKVLNVGVGVKEDSVEEFYVYSKPALSTFSREEVNYRKESGFLEIPKVVKVQMKTINSIIKDHFKGYPDILSIDIEGVDLMVLKSLNFVDYPIPIICAETCTFSESHIKPKDPSISNFLVSKGYFTYADTYINTIFVNKSWFLSVCKPSE